MKLNTDLQQGFNKFFDGHLFRFGTLRIMALVLALVLLFQNCQPGTIALKESPQQSDLSVCNGVSCTLDPITDKIAVTTILLALGDQIDTQLVINGASSQLIAETVIRYTSPVRNPKILVVRDFNIAGEDPEDTSYVADVLLARYQPQFMIEPETGLLPMHVQNYDLIWFNNPGHPMSSKISYQTLLAFSGAIVLQGDDLSRGASFSMQDLTHIKYIDNGTSVTCEDGKSYNHDNNKGYQYRVSLNPEKMPGANKGSLEFIYGNDIDLVSLALSDIEILASALPGPEVCKQSRPAIVRYTKP